MDYGHYIISPYRYKPQLSKKLVPAEFVDLGEGLLEIIDEVYRELNEDS
jgi:UDP-glucose 4-epimerase